MKFRMLIVCVTLLFSFAVISAQTKTESKDKAADTKKAACCTKDAKTAMNSKDCCKSGPNTGKECTDAEKANCAKMTAGKTGEKMDCCKDKTTKTTKTTKTKAKTTKTNPESKETK